jgi:hypothetical protein
MSTIMSASRQSSPPPFALDSLPVTQQALQVLQLFQTASNVGELRAVNKRWSTLRPRLLASESKLECSSAGAGSDKAIALDVLGDLVEAPLELIIALVQLTLAFSGGEKDEFLAALKNAYDEALKEGVDKIQEKVTERITKAPLEKAGKRLREALLQYLQSISQRSRKHFAELIDATFGTLKGLGGAVALAAKAMAPTTISPEWCGLLAQIDSEQDRTFRRVFPMPDAAVGLPILHH